MYARVVLGATKVSLLERCPQFRGVLIEGFHCSGTLACTPEEVVHVEIITSRAPSFLYSPTQPSSTR